MTKNQCSTCRSNEYYPDHSVRAIGSAAELPTLVQALFAFHLVPAGSEPIHRSPSLPQVVATSKTNSDQNGGALSCFYSSAKTLNCVLKTFKAIPHLMSVHTSLSDPSTKLIKTQLVLSLFRQFSPQQKPCQRFHWTWNTYEPMGCDSGKPYM